MELDHIRRDSCMFPQTINNPGNGSWDGSACIVHTKSCLLYTSKIIMKETPPDSGDVIVAKGKTIGYLSQHQSVTSHHTIYDELLEVKKDVLELFQRMNELELSMKHTEGPELDQMLNTYARLTHEFESANGRCV